MMVAIKYSARVYVAFCLNDKLGVATGHHDKIFAWPVDPEAQGKIEETARRWLGDHSLRKSKARALLAAAIRNEGPFADPKHKARVLHERLTGK